MPYYIGIDEAGYGPNYGPLVIGATVWRTLPKRSHFSKNASITNEAVVDWYKTLQGIIADSPMQAASKDKTTQATVAPIAIADSKTLYKPKHSFWPLERGVLGALAACETVSAQTVSCWRSLLDALGADSENVIERTLWYKKWNRKLPSEGTEDALQQAAKLLQSSKNAAVMDVQAAAIFAQKFNALCEERGNKAEVLTAASLQLLLRVLKRLPERNNRETTHVLFDKHGGRKHYAAPLQHYFPECHLQIQTETAAESRYLISGSDGTLDIRFCRGGEANMPTALASMTAKYVRELAMVAFNAFWLNHLPTLRPTAGYPLDAKRFRQAIAPVQKKLEISDSALWRSR